MSDRSKTTPSKVTRAEERRDAKIEAGADDTEGPEPSGPDATADEDVAEHYEEMTARGAAQQGEGRLP